MPPKEEKTVTIFEAVGKKERDEAIRNLISGRTPNSEIQKRDGRGNEQWDFVNTYYMTRQISLVTGFRWKSECLEERFLPNENSPREVGAKMLVTIWDADDREYSHQSWGQKDIARWSNDGKGHKKGDTISVFDDLKAAYSDGIKKCLSYVGIANDVYGGKEREFFATDEESEGTVDFSGSEAASEFGKFLNERHIRPSEACKILGIDSLKDIKDFKEAHDKIVEEKSR